MLLQPCCTDSRGRDIYARTSSRLIHRVAPISLLFVTVTATQLSVPPTYALSLTSGSLRSTCIWRLGANPTNVANEEGLTVEPLSLDEPGNGDNEWNTMSTFGAALLQLRKEEEEIMHEIGQELSNRSESKSLKSPMNSETTPELPEFKAIDVGAATELDNSVERISSQELKEDMTVLPLTLPGFLIKSQSGSQLSDMPLSRPEHYSDRIDRDKRLLAIGITESVDEPWQWRRFCEEKGGIKPLVKMIQNGANFVQHEQQGSEFLLLMEEYEETFLAACMACRALRELCSISDDVRAVITDEILRANAEAGDNQLMKDFSSLLRHAHEAEIEYNSRSKQRPRASKLFRLMARKDRRGEFCS